MQTPSRQSSAGPKTPRSVRFAPPAADYTHDLEDLLDLSSSSDESDDNVVSHPSDSFAASLTDESVASKLTYLDYIDYKALMASLRTQEQHDTAHHLMTVAMLRQSPADEYTDIASRPLRRGWTAWPLSPADTVHACPDLASCRQVLHEELSAALHRHLTSQLRASDKTVSADELPDSVTHTITDSIMDKVTHLMRSLAAIRSAQGGTKPSTRIRLGLMTHLDVLTVLRHANIMSAQDLSTVESRCRQLFGTPCTNSDMDSENTRRLETIDDVEEDEVKLGAGRWDLRGTKRRRVVEEPIRDAQIDDEQTSAGARYTITSDPGRRFDNATRLVPARLIKEEG